MLTCRCGAERSHLLHLLVLPDASVRHEEVRVILLAERNLLHRRFVQLRHQLRCERHARQLTRRPHSDVITRCVCVCVCTHGDASLCTGWSELVVSCHQSAPEWPLPAPEKTLHPASRSSADRSPSGPERENIKLRFISLCEAL